MKVRVANQQSIAEGLTQRIRALTAGLAELSEYVQLVTRDVAKDVRTAALENDTSTKPIEFVTENGFTIVRPWETNGSQAPAGGRFQFLVRDPHNAECVVTVDVASELFAETAFDTRGHIEFSSSYWICCAERHLADYVWEHDAFPDNDRLLVETLDPEEVILATRWENSE